jgi:hypothetical protein
LTIAVVTTERRGSVDKWIPTIALAVGSILTIVGGLLTEWFKENRSTAKERDARTYAELQDWRKFQSETVLELQNTLHELFKIVGAHWVRHSENGQWELTPAEKMEYGEPNSRVELIRSRVADDRVRNLAQSTQDFGGETLGSKSTDEARKNWDRFQQSYLAAVEAAGGVYRSVRAGA